MRLPRAPMGDGFWSGIRYNSHWMMPSPQSTGRTRTAAIISRPGRPELATILPGLIEWLRARDYQIIVDSETSVYVAGQQIVARPEMSARPLDLAVVLGGDGTLLSAARAMAAAGVPLLGVNLGALGFLTEVPLAALYPMLDAIQLGEAPIESRALIRCTLARGETVLGTYQVFNDVVVNKTAHARLNNYDLYIDKIFVSSYRADGLIVSTPTGSTAYSLSAGGPVLMPTVKALLVTPVSPHSLTHRPLVVPDSSEIEILLRGGQEEAYVSLDGQSGTPLRDGDRVICVCSGLRVNLFRTSTNFFDVLRTKLKWGER